MLLPLSFISLSSILLGSCVEAAKPPIVSLPYGTFQGFNSGNLTKFLGIPFAHSPRFETPQPPRRLHGVQNATVFGPACPQQKITPPFAGFIQPSYPTISEDCLTLDVFKPVASNTTMLPVFVWIYGGGFQIGNSRDTDMSPLVERSIEGNEPIIVVALNYRLTALGFLAGKEVGSAGISNLGLRDQIYGLEWVQKHISEFGGDPKRVVIGGQSAGARSTSLLLLSNKQNSNSMFRGAFMVLRQQSGGPGNAPPLAEGQPDYDDLVAATNCTTSSSTLDCLRHTPFESLMTAITSTADVFSYQSLNLVWNVRIDGDVIVEDPLVSVSHGAYAKVPIMTGNCEDEGTLFSTSQGNITTSEEFLDYVHSKYVSYFLAQEIAQIGTLYPDDPTQGSCTGSPFNTGTANELTCEFKRLAAFSGDFGFIGGRRFFLEHASKTQNAWSWLIKRGKNAIPPLGVVHGGDFPIWFLVGSPSETVGGDSLINFVNTLDPNRPASSATTKPAGIWPTWKTPSAAGNHSLFTFNDPYGVNVTAENFRVEAIAVLNNLLLKQAIKK
ncbi:sterol esterase [Mycena crocata]|nr:sterol esterase [Mycena crocata]